MINVNATLVVQIINLLVLIFILNRLMYKPIKKIVAERARRLDEGHAEAIALRETAEGDAKSYKEQITKGRSRVRADSEELRKETKYKVQQIILEAQETAKQHQVAILQTIEKDMDQSREEIGAEAEKVALTFTKRLLGREVA